MKAGIPAGIPMQYITSNTTSTVQTIALGNINTYNSPILAVEFGVYDTILTSIR